MEDVSQVLVGALKDVEEAKVPEDLREIAFKEAIRLREGSGQGPGGPSGEGQGPSGSSGTGVIDGSALEKIASRFQATPTEVGEVFTERDGEIGLGIGTRSLDDSKRPATREIALLIAGARQAATGEDWTPVNEIRTWCEHYGKYDAPNFAKTIAAMDDMFQFSGKGQKREVRLRQPAWEAAGDLVRRMVGAD